MRKISSTMGVGEERKEKNLQKAIEEANRANQAKSNFLSHVSHDIRTPLNVILSFSNEEIINDATEQELREYLKKINISGEYLRGIINNVLDMSKIEQNEFLLRPEPYDLNTFEETIQSVIGELCCDKNIEFVMDMSQVDIPGIVVDQVRFNQIFINLLSNAVKFTPEGGKIEFHIQKHGTAEKKNILRFTVRDNGIGMSEDFIPHAFESFTQEYRNDMEGQSGGTGLGLSIVKELVKMMEGNLQLESEMNKGTIFTIDIPVEPVEQRETASMQRNMSHKELNGIHILLAEDNRLNSEIAVVLLKRRGCMVDCVKNGKEVCDKFEQSEQGYYQIILMDIQMPIMNGLTAAQTIRKMKRKDAKTIPIISMSADAFVEDKRAACKAGMYAYISKPIDVETLYNVCSQFVEK